MVWKSLWLCVIHRRRLCNACMSCRVLKLTCMYHNDTTTWISLHVLCRRTKCWHQRQARPARLALFTNFFVTWEATGSERRRPHLIKRPCISVTSDCARDVFRYMTRNGHKKAWLSLEVRADAINIRHLRGRHFVMIYVSFDNVDKFIFSFFTMSSI